ncbi:STAS domain-containing protein [Kitasatospora sp. NPDC056327]|uniref:STAS domain-containing protein n=1 Tax=Kitasatospora sp. NPDC056327 TaxID=3345785 RepID=UPI0035DD1DD0
MPTNDTSPYVPPPPLRATIRREPGATVVSLAGEVDQDQYETVRTRLAEAVRTEPSCLVVDLAGVGFCDSSGLNALLRARLDCEGRGVRLVLAAPTAQLRRLLDLTGAGEVFTVCDDVPAAVAVGTAAAR